MTDQSLSVGFVSNGAIQYAIPETVTGRCSDSPQLSNLLIGQSQPIINQIMVPYGANNNTTGLLPSVNSGSVVPPEATPTLYVPNQQSPGQTFDQTILLLTTIDTYLQFRISRHRVDGRSSLSTETVQKSIIAGVNLFSNQKGDLKENVMFKVQCPEDMNTYIHIERFSVGTSEEQILSVIRFAAVQIFVSVQQSPVDVLQRPPILRSLREKLPCIISSVIMKAPLISRQALEVPVEQE
ncbi:hypothetical protein ONS95_001005 [Cadophora gregata]|uniref:uncharacterized protein n=1 Tax=Cadophora gregata TaxID=51156 RepID=UPI0026DAFD12|nr:uncharacterized protein ONS95_001005 [Cadophora gregata]KAK0102200.1 hypothetical protein ONS96_006161 [Cadophora gregata f. sp. sojae]KAK0129064.1 hypothetical protein ONS95_001005 [Cadophora gregata]